MLPRVVTLVCVLAVAGTAAGCAKARAADAPVMPTLAPPEAPPRVVAEYEPDPPLPAAPVPPEAVTAPPRPARPPRREAPRAEPVEETVPAAPAVPTPAPPSLTLQTPAASGQAEQSVRVLLAKAARDLGRVDYQMLDNDGKAQYDTARRFMQQADEALKARNVRFAGTLADKAATMAAVLVR